MTNKHFTNNIRVVITGIGMVCPLGNNVNDSWYNIIQGLSAADYITHFDASTWTTKFACEVKNFNFITQRLKPNYLNLLSRPLKFVISATDEAIQDASLNQDILQNCGISMGVGIGDVYTKDIVSLLKDINLNKGIEDLPRQFESANDLWFVIKNHPGFISIMMSKIYQCFGPINTIHTACTSSAHAITLAYDQIKRGEAKIMIAGGTDSLAQELYIAGFCLLGALSKRNDNPKEASRPFDKDRDGFVASEGAAVLVLEEMTHAQARGANIYAEMLGYGSSANAYRITDIPEDAASIIFCMESAIKNSDIDFMEVGYINAHGTSTPLNDKIEAYAISRVFGKRGYNPYVSSTKSQIGHLISAAGAIEACVCVLSLKHEVLPPSINLYQTDCEPLNYVANKHINKKVDVVISNSFGFGGSNVSLVFGRS